MAQRTPPYNERHQVARHRRRPPHFDIRQTRRQGPLLQPSNHQPPGTTRHRPRRIGQHRTVQKRLPSLSAHIDNKCKSHGHHKHTHTPNPEHNAHPDDRTALNIASFVDSIRFSSSDFTSSLTLSSECFATFLHSTCSLSDSWGYLALDDVYHQLCAALSSNTTLRSYQK